VDERSITQYGRAEKNFVIKRVTKVKGKFQIAPISQVFNLEIDKKSRNLGVFGGHSLLYEI